MINTYIICGIDRLGKDTLIRNIQNNQGFHFIQHYSKPLKLDYYCESEKAYQYESFCAGFNLMQITKNLENQIPVIFNRFHLGETVYSPLYRHYNGDYVFELERIFNADKLTNVKLILLTTSDFTIINDDGESFDFKNSEVEQEMFISAFDTSIFPNKIKIDVSNGTGAFKTQEEIVKEALSND